MEDTLTYSRLEALMNYWYSTPPTHVSVARYLGYKPAAKTANQSQKPEYMDLPEVEE